MTTRLFTGDLPDGCQILVTVFDYDFPNRAEVAFRHPNDTWGPPTELTEEM